VIPREDQTRRVHAWQFRLRNWRTPNRTWTGPVITHFFSAHTHLSIQQCRWHSDMNILGAPRLWWDPTKVFSQPFFPLSISDTWCGIHKRSQVSDTSVFHFLFEFIWALVAASWLTHVVDDIAFKTVWDILLLTFLKQCVSYYQATIALLPVSRCRRFYKIGTRMEVENVYYALTTQLVIATISQCSTYWGTGKRHQRCWSTWCCSVNLFVKK
jgi:hypothetical protein